MAALRVTLINARDLVASDSGLEGKTSEPFVVFHVGKEIQQSSCIIQQLNPEWRPREIFKFLVVNAEKDILILYVADTAHRDVTLLMWENEVWSLTSGWIPSDTSIYRRYSTYDDTVTSNRFDQVAPSAPKGMEAHGWCYVLDTNRDDAGWQYGYNFLGPFTGTKTMSSYVRRRLWENTCIPATRHY